MPARRRRRATAASVAITAAAGLLLAGCGAFDRSVPVLADLEGWDEATGERLADPSADAALEVAVDEAAARRLWERTVPEGEREGEAALADVDHAQEVVALWTFGQSSACPETLRQVGLQDGTVVLRTEPDGGGSQICTSDFSAAREVVVLDRDDLPPLDQLEATPARVRSGGQDGGAVVLLTVTAEP